MADWVDSHVRQITLEYVRNEARAAGLKVVAAPALRRP
jgi:hypothetical protein